MFDFPCPFNDRLKETYESKWRFSDDVIEAVLYMFKHPKHNPRWYKMCNELMTKGDANDMLKAAYRLYEEYKAHPQQYGHSLENMTDQMIVSMWRVFISLHTKARKNITDDKYRRAAVKAMSKYCKEVFLDKLVNCEVIEHDKRPSPKHPEGLTEADRARRGLGTHEGSKNFEYLCSLGENEIGSLL